MKTLEQINQELDAAIPRSVVSEREGGNGKKLAYLAGHYVIDRLNKVFGPFGWASDVKSLQLVHQGTTEDRYGKPVHSVHYVAQVRLVVEGPDGIRTEHNDVGYGDGSDKNNIGKAHELAVKEAVTDALKRCAKNLGQSMGLALYDKEQTNVVEDEPKAEEKKPAQAAAPAPAASSRPSAKGQHDNRPKAGAIDRELVNKKISALSRILINQGRATTDELKAELKKEYNVEAKEMLSDEQASQFAARLEKAASA